MRIAALGLVGAIGLAVSALSANAAPLAPAAVPPQASNIVQAAVGCGWGFHHNRWGHCIAYHHRHYRPYAYWRPHWRGYYGGGYGPWWGPPSDHVADQLNRQVLNGLPGY
jgi:hypothetical protein